MSLKITSNKNNVLKLSVDKMNPATANALRRIMMSEVPIMAIEDVKVRENNSALFNELLSHRLGLIPMTFDGKIDTASFVLKKEGPCTVYSGDLVGTDKHVKPLYDNIPIVKLHENQRIDLEADAILGTGNEHAKWQAALSAYEYDGDKFNFTIESISGLSPEAIFKKSIEILAEKAEELEDAL